MERGGNYDWIAIAAKLLHELAEPDHIIAELQQLARKVFGLRERLVEAGTPKAIIETPNVGHNHHNERIKRWQLA